MPERPATHRWFQFRLRTLLIVVALLAVPLAYEANLVRARQEMIDRIQAEDPYTCIPNFKAQRIGWLRRTLGDYDVESITLPDSMVHERKQVERLFPEARVNVRQGGEKIASPLP